MLATVLGGQGIVIMLGATLARSMAATSGKHSPTLVLTLGLTVSAIFLGLWVLSLVKGSAVDVSMAQRT